MAGWKINPSTPPVIFVLFLTLLAVLPDYDSISFVNVFNFRICASRLQLPFSIDLASFCPSRYSLAKGQF